MSAEVAGEKAPKKGSEWWDGYGALLYGCKRRRCATGYQHTGMAENRLHGRGGAYL
jgi:hypothetical protein